MTITFVKFSHGLPCANSKLYFTDEDEIAEFTYLEDPLDTAVSLEYLFT